ncbi:hypothetical protein OS493_034635 [Desmophyllum pertusum]|uniref:MANSC domain-containing protein n=1 Tax=Desmophyllum pertusum TaxID=174260 RepID=A0A9W9ZK92_9CNID|nr:hypothetical protein OS493_034635 [Desmophyllum pertusum]
MLSYRKHKCYGASCGEPSCLYRRKRSAGPTSRYGRKTGSVTVSQNAQQDAVWPRSRATKCKKSAIVFNVTLANGYQSGKFVDHGDLGAMSVCQDLCCQSHKCDAAFMAGKRCFSVHCHNQVQCLWMPAKDNKYMLQLSYIDSVHSISNSAASLKVNHPTEVILKVEADAKPIKTHRTGHKPTAHTVSRNQRKNKALPNSVTQ